MRIEELSYSLKCPSKKVTICLLWGQIQTFEILEEKIKPAKETFETAGIKDIVKLVEGDARKNLE